MRTNFTVLIVCAVFAGFFPQHAAALESEWAEADEIRARLVVVPDSLGPDQKIFEGALDVQLSPGWHTYWRSPGDSGLPLRFDWAESANLSAADIAWPAPQRFNEYDLQTFGYRDAVALPLRFTAENTGQDVRLDLHVEALVCLEICIPQSLSLQLIVPAGDGAVDEAAVSLVENAKKRLPFPGDTAALKIENVVAGPKGLVVDTYSQGGFERLDVFVELEEFALSAPPQMVIRADDERLAQILIPAPDHVENFYTVAQDGEIVITITHGDTAIERRISFETPAPPAQP